MKLSRTLSALGCLTILSGQLILLAGCASTDNNLPSITPPSDVQTPDSLTEIATSMSSCLDDAGITTTLEAQDNQLSLVRFPDSVPVIWGYPNEVVQFTAVVSDAEVAEIFSGDGGTMADDTFLLLVNHVDHSQTLKECVTRSGYSESRVFEETNSAALASQYVMLILQASNEWASCARENGWPSTKDATAPLSSVVEVAPIALLPPTITEAELRDLLVTCPAFSPDIAKKNEKLLSEYTGSSDSFPDEYREQPNIGFDYPGFDGTSTPDGSTDEKTVTHLTQLMGILMEAENEYWESG